MQLMQSRGILQNFQQLSNHQPSLWLHASWNGILLQGEGGSGGGGGVFAKCLCVRNIADDGSYTFGVKRLRYEPRYTGVIRLDNPFIYCYFFSGAGLL